MFSTKKKDKITFHSYLNKHAGVVQTYLVIISLLFVIVTVLDTGEVFTLNKNQLIATQNQLEITKSALDSSAKANGRIIHYLDSISKSSMGLLTNVNSISDTISRFPNKLNTVSNSLSSLNLITKKYTDATEKEFDKEADIQFNYISQKDRDISFQLVNVGEVIGYIDRIIISIPNLDCDISLQSRNIGFSNDFTDNNDSTKYFGWADFGYLIPKESKILRAEFSYNPNEFTSDTRVNVTIQIVFHSLNQKGKIVTKDFEYTLKYTNDQ